MDNKFRRVAPLPTGRFPRLHVTPQIALCATTLVYVFLEAVGLSEHAFIDSTRVKVSVLMGLSGLSVLGLLTGALKIKARPFILVGTIAAIFALAVDFSRISADSAAWVFGDLSAVLAGVLLASTSSLKPIRPIVLIANLALALILLNRLPFFLAPFYIASLYVFRDAKREWMVTLGCLFTSFLFVHNSTIVIATLASAILTFPWGVQIMNRVWGLKIPQLAIISVLLISTFAPFLISNSLINSLECKDGCLEVPITVSQRIGEAQLVLDRAEAGNPLRLVFGYGPGATLDSSSLSDESVTNLNTREGKVHNIHLLGPMLLLRHGLLGLGLVCILVYVAHPFHPIRGPGAVLFLTSIVLSLTASGFFYWSTLTWIGLGGMLAYRASTNRWNWSTIAGQDAHASSRSREF